MTTKNNSDKTPLLKELENQIKSGPVPRHVAIIMDGNGRWAKARGYSRIKGHQAGARNVKTVVRCADRVGVEFVSLFVFSSENWTRPSLEVSALMRLIRTYLARERQELHEEGFRFNMMGRRENLAPEVIEEALKSRDLMKNNKGTMLNLCINYGGRAEIIDAVKRMVEANLKPEEISEKTLEKFLYAPDISDPDLIIRTSGEMRISNFLLWECAYSELYFTHVNWPDFNEMELLNAILEYQKRERRFGKTGDQIKAEKK
ncbi:MAG: isoprenyl transferase [Candidatus Riflebacteria bacterium]|nr:isoprenyl transferase [Candidatus Riflebacteria bacterium]